MSKVWFITGHVEGLWPGVGRRRRSQRGDRVAATARDAATLAPLGEQLRRRGCRRCALDVTDRAAVCEAAVAGAHGALRAARRRRQQRRASACSATIEEVSEAAGARSRSRRTCSARSGSPRRRCPILREQGSGHVIQVSSIGGVNAFPMVGLYHASKWGLEGFSQSLAQEVAEFGIKVTLVEPIGYATDWVGPLVGLGRPDRRLRRRP